MSRARRGTKRSAVLRRRPGTFANMAFGTIPDQRCIANALHRVRETWLGRGIAASARFRYLDRNVSALRP
jgi:hypothetical protein